MKRLFTILMLTVIATVLMACGNKDDDELTMLEVEFEPQSTASVGDTVELKTIVTFGDEDVTDAEEMEFEYWIGDGEEEPEERDATFVEAINNEDGTYSIDVTFEEPGEYWIYAHTTARDLHTMPKRSITVE